MLQSFGFLNGTAIGKGLLTEAAIGTGLLTPATDEHRGLFPISEKGRRDGAMVVNVSNRKGNIAKACNDTTETKNVTCKPVSSENSRRWFVKPRSASYLGDRNHFGVLLMLSILHHSKHEISTELAFLSSTTIAHA